MFVFKKIYELNHRMEIIVSEQVENNSCIDNFILIHPKTRHLKYKLNKIFNKSFLINRASEMTTCDYIWVIDSDFYTNYENVLDNIENFGSFTRPFSEVICLDKNETDNLIETEYVNVSRDDYESSSATGKYSFIVERTIFNESKKMNESFKGWGYQDLDFVENRLVSKNIKNLENYGFHLYHEPASREYVNENKLIYMGYKKTKSLEQIPTISVETNKNTYTEKKDKKQTRHQLDKIEVAKNKKIDKIHFNYNNTNVKNFTKKYNVSSTLLKTNLSGTRVKYNTSKNFLFYYIQYIQQNYNKITRPILFTNDFFVKNNKIFNRNCKCILTNKYTDYTEDNFKWVSEIKKRHFSKKNIIESFQLTNIGNFVKKNRYRYSENGFVVINNQSIKKHKHEFYTNLLNKMENWKPTDYELMLCTLEYVFT